MTPADTFHLLLAIACLLTAAHAVGYVFRRLRQPPVIGEILGGLALGPTLLGAVAPTAHAFLFLERPSTAIVLASIYECGLLLLMFCSGAEIRAAFHGADRKTVALITLTGTLAPFLLAAAAFSLIDPARHMGPANSQTALLLVFGVGVAVTSIPVISRILFDLKLLETDFARIVLSAAVLEDVLLYIVLAIALSLAGGQHEAAFALPAALGASGADAWGVTYHALATLAFFGLALRLGPRLFRWAERFRYNLAHKASPLAHQLIFLMLMTAIAGAMGVALMFGAFVAGVIVGRTGERTDELAQGGARVPGLPGAGHGPATAGEAPAPPGESQRPASQAAREAIKTFSFAFFIPIYFAIVGLKLDLLRAFDPLFFLGFLVFACIAKAVSVALGAWLAGERTAGVVNLAVAMNARGGPGIVLASLAFDAGIINDKFYATLVLLAMVTSLLAGAWLGRVVQRGAALR